MYSNSRNDVPRVAQRYGTIAAHTRRRASVLVVFVVFCEHMHSFAGLIRRTPPPTFSDTAITDRYFPAQSSLGADILVYWIGKIVRTCAPGGSRTSTSCMQGEHPIHRPGSQPQHMSSQVWSLIKTILCTIFLRL